MSDPPVDPTLKEFRRKRRVLDQMLTGHSLLRDVYQRRALVLTLLILGLAILATALAFVNGESTATILGISARVQVWVGLLTALIFFLSLVDLRVDWRQRAGAHQDAVRRLAVLKGHFNVADTDLETGGRADEIGQEYEAVMEQIAPIPERWFLRAKAKHLRKVRASQLLDTHPGVPAWWVKLLATWEGMRRKGQT